MTVTASLSDQERIELELAHLKALLDKLLSEKIRLDQMIEYVEHELRKRYAEAEEYAKRSY